MEYAIHLTGKCNLNCKYCYENKNDTIISLENIKKLIDYEINKKSKNAIIAFYGGEPLLQKDLIKQTIEYIKSKKSKTKFFFGITTNGTLLDDEVIEYMKKNKFVNVSYSFDGNKETQDLNRITVDGKGSFEIVKNNAKKLLKVFKNAVAMSVVTKNNLSKLNENVEYLINFGFQYINLLIDYTVNWQDEDLEILKNQLTLVAETYKNKTLEGIEIRIPLIDQKIKTYVQNDFNCNEECKLGFDVINVGTDGNFYPCMQFVGKEEFIIGNCNDGIDEEARKKLLLKAHKEQDVCKECAINKRCKHTCPCKNYMLTKDINELSPFVCESEKIIIEVADKMAEELYKENKAVFIKKYHNSIY